MSIRDLYKEALGDHLSELYDEVAENEQERINVAAEVDLSRLALTQSSKAVTALISKEGVKESSKLMAWDLLRKAITQHVQLVSYYVSIAEKASIATPERMRVYFEKLKLALIAEFVPEEDPEQAELFGRVWKTIEGVRFPKTTERKLEITIS